MNKWVPLYLAMVITSSILSSGCLDFGEDDPDVEFEILSIEKRDVDTEGKYPREGYYFLLLRLKAIHGNDGDDVSLSPNNFELVTNNNSIYDHYNLFGAIDELPSETEVDFFITFEIRENEEAKELLFRTHWQDEPIITNIPPIIDREEIEEEDEETQEQEDQDDKPKNRPIAVIQVYGQIVEERVEVIQFNEVLFNGTLSEDPIGKGLNYSWDLNGDFREDTTGINPTYVYNTSMTIMVTLWVEDADGKTDSEYIHVKILPADEPEDGMAE